MNFSVESKYPISIFKDNKVVCSWATIKVGWDLNRITKEEIKKFALEYLEQHSTTVNEYISELILGIKNEEVSIYLKRIFESLGLKEPQKYTPEWNKEWLKWRYCIMSEMAKSILDEEKLLISIEGVYADFDYPEDMTEFIYYMPRTENLDNKQQMNPQEARNKLVKKLKIFLKNEKAKIDQNIDSLSSRVIEKE